MLWVAPTEHQIHEILSGENHQWKVSSLPEKHGYDILCPTKQGIYGFQRKTLPDLVASIQDGRLYYELNQMSVSATVRLGYLIVEGAFHTNIEGTHYTEANISVGTLRTLIAKFHTFGIGYVPTASPLDTIHACIGMSKYLSSGRAETVHRQKQVSNEWGQSDSKAYGVFLLQSFPGIGPKVAAAIYDHFNGAPITWAVDAAELARVPGIGRKRAEALIAALAPVRGREAAAGPVRP
jgi:ERCC4-type nuclease